MITHYSPMYILIWYCSNSWFLLSYNVYLTWDIETTNLTVVGFRPVLWWCSISRQAEHDCNNETHSFSSQNYWRPQMSWRRVVLRALTATSAPPTVTRLPLTPYYAYEEMLKSLEEKDPHGPLWGLNRCTWRDGSTIFLCDKHMAASKQSLASTMYE